jgi:antitoxin component HigA of HigAB toxin-antitoxin module
MLEYNKMRMRYLCKMIRLRFLIKDHMNVLKIINQRSSLTINISFSITNTFKKPKDIFTSKTQHKV